MGKEVTYPGQWTLRNVSTLMMIQRTLAVSSFKLQVSTWKIQGTCLHRSARKFSSQGERRTSAKVCEMVKQNKRSSGWISVTECWEAISWNSHEKWHWLGWYILLFYAAERIHCFITILFWTVVKVWFFLANMYYYAKLLNEINFKSALITCFPIFLFVLETCMRAHITQQKYVWFSTMFRI